MNQKFDEAIQLIDKANALDPNKVMLGEKEYPKELLYSQRMTEVLASTVSEPSEALQIAIRAQHIRRWAIARKEYPMDRTGYYQWRNDLKKMHAETASDILQKVGYDAEFIDRVSFLINKKSIKKDSESQTLEDVACLVFLRYYMADFIAKHTDEKVIGIIQKTWKKMSSEGHTLAQKINFSDRGAKLIAQALETS